MRYFENLPKILYTNSNGDSVVMTNLLARVSVIADILTNPLVFYQYDIQEGDTPDIVAYKYYGSVDRFWIVLVANKMLNPQWDWPLNGTVLNDYVTKKYPLIDVYTTPHHYTKTITQTDLGTNVTTTNVVEIDQTTYNTYVPKSLILTLPAGNVSYSETLGVVNVFQYESDLNESKRTINLLNSAYASQVETEFVKLMNK